MERSNLLAEACFQFQDQFTVAGLVVVHVGDENDSRQVVLFAEVPGFFRAGLNAGLAVDDDDSGIRDAYSFLDFADKIKISGRIQNVDLNRSVFAVGILNRDQGCGNGKAAFLFFFIEIADRISGSDRAHLRDRLRHKCHGFGYRRFTGTSVSEKNDIANLFRTVNFHKLILLS